MTQRILPPGKHDLIVPRWLVITLASLVILLVVFLVTRTSARRVHIDFATGERGIEELLETMAGVTRGPLTTGNEVVVLQNGRFFDAMMKDLESAKESIHFETYVWWSGELPARLGELLSRKAREGVIVRVLVDASGSSRGDDSVFEGMEQAGVKLARFGPFRLSNLGHWNKRDHRKLTIIDGRIGYVSGHGVADEWKGDARSKDEWRDTAARLEGPIVAQMQAVFCENWIRETGEVPAGEIFFPAPTREGGTTTHLAWSSADGAVSAVELLYVMAIAAAREEILIQNPYFLPDKDVLERLAAAVRRGVKVRVMLPSAEVNDSAIVQHASHHRYGFLIENGVELYEYDHTLLHQKIMIVDGVWSSIGSTNFDDRSFEINHEVTLGILGRPTAAELRAAWEQDMRHARRVTPSAWSERGIIHQLQDGAAFLMKEQL